MAEGNINLVHIPENVSIRTTGGDTTKLTFYIDEYNSFIIAGGDTFCCVNIHQNGLFVKYDPNNVVTKISNKSFEVSVTRWLSIFVLATGTAYTIG